MIWFVGESYCVVDRKRVQISRGSNRIVSHQQTIDSVFCANSYVNIFVPRRVWNDADTIPSDIRCGRTRVSPVTWGYEIPDTNRDVADRPILVELCTTGRHHRGWSSGGPCNRMGPAPDRIDTGGLTVSALPVRWIIDRLPDNGFSDQHYGHPSIL